LIFVSHDRAFVSALATRVLEVTASGFKDFPGTYDEFLERSGDDHLDVETVVLKAKKQREDESTSGVSPAALSWEAAKKKKSRQKQLIQRRDELLAEIDQASARKAEIHARWCEPGFYETTPAAEIAELEREEREIDPHVAELEKAWEAIEGEIESLAGDG
jgi:ATPase subunit of ABC transporter with duplicated ATPase domains